MRGFGALRATRVAREAGSSSRGSSRKPHLSVANVPMTLPSTVALYPPPSGSVSMPPPGDWGEASRRVFGVATSSPSFCDLPRWGRALVPLLFGGMRPSAAKSERKLQHCTLHTSAGLTADGNLPETSSRFTSARPAARVVEMVTPTVLKFEVRPRTPCRSRPHRWSSAACAAEPGRRRRLRNRTRTRARTRPNPPRASCSVRPAAFPPFARRLTTPAPRNAIRARRRSPTARCP